MPQFRQSVSRIFGMSRAEINLRTEPLRDEVVIDFYGQVINDVGKPVSGAKVQAHMSRTSVNLDTSAWANHYDVHYTAITDDQGGFSISGKGKTLTIDSIHGPGQWLYDKAPWHGKGTDVGTKIFVFKLHPNDLEYISDPNNPAILVLVREGHQPQVWPSRGGSDPTPNGRQPNGPKRPIVPSIPIE
ncbi:MAG: hypothetical protein AAFY08_15560 [Planctomycetota bacterium]